MKIRIKLVLPMAALFFIAFALFVAYLIINQSSGQKMALAKKADMMSSLVAMTNAPTV